MSVTVGRWTSTRSGSCVHGRQCRHSTRYSCQLILISIILALSRNRSTLMMVNNQYSRVHVDSSTRPLRKQHFECGMSLKSQIYFLMPLVLLSDATCFVSINPPSSRASRAAWLICLNRSAPSNVPPKYLVTTTSTSLTSFIRYSSGTTSQKRSNSPVSVTNEPGDNLLRIHRRRHYLKRRFQINQVRLETKRLPW